MKYFQGLLVILTLTIASYTLIAGNKMGWDLFTVFITDIKSITWAGQFNIDFSSYLFLSFLWISWRSKFSAKGVFLGLVAQILGILFFAPYLLYLSDINNGDMKKILLGKNYLDNND